MRLTIAGHPDVLFTLRDADEGRLLTRLVALLQRFPRTEAPLVQPPTSAPSQKGWCHKHQGQMKLNTKDGCQWYRHRCADGSFCKGK